MKVLTHWETTLKVLRILLSEELEMEAGYGEGEIVQSFRLLNWSLSPFQWGSFGLFIGVEKLILMMT